MYSDEYIKAMRTDFRNFCHHIWKHLELPKLTPVQNDIAHYIQHGPDRSQVSAFRGVGKSYVTAAYVAWVLWNDREIKIMVISAGKDRADAFAIFVRNLIKTVPLLKYLEPDKSKGERSTQNVFDVSGCIPSGSPSVKSVGISGQLTGSRADIIIADDIEVVSNSATHDLREKLARLVTEFDAVIKPQGQIKYLGTPQTELSLYNLLYTRGYDMRIWTALVPTDIQAEAYGAKLAPFIRKMMGIVPVGTSTDPLRFTDEDLAVRKLSYGRSGFALQFMLDTSLADGDKFPLKINDLVISGINNKLPTEVQWSANPVLKLKELPNVAMAGQYYYAPENLSDDFREPEMSIMSIDPSGRGKDETAYSVAYMLHGNIFVPECGGMMGGYTDDTLKKLCLIAKKNNVNKILVESNFGDGMFTQLLKPHLMRIHPCEIEEVRQHQQKELRIIDTLEPLMNQHRLIIDPKVIQTDYDSALKNFPPDKAPQYMLMYQMSRLSKDRGSLKHDDRLDSLAIACKYFLDILDVDQTLRANQEKEVLLDKALQQFQDEWYEDNGGSNNQGLKLWGR
jgi:hypothetical protein